MHFGSCFNKCINGFSENDRIVVLGDMNAKLGNREVFSMNAQMVSVRKTEL